MVSTKTMYNLLLFSVYFIDIFDNNLIDEKFIQTLPSLCLGKK